jgi:hypothetical protein
MTVVTDKVNSVGCRASFPREVKVGGKDCVCTTFIQVNSKAWDVHRKRNASREVEDDVKRGGATAARRMKVEPHHNPLSCRSSKGSNEVHHQDIVYL